jgi:hypothetical protein
MARAPIDPAVQATILTRSRRRCCICYGLKRDHAIKQGQIAHIDRDSANAKEENLAFMCLEHHDWYDSTTRQSKGPQAAEARQYRDELYSAMDAAMAKAIILGAGATTELEVAGRYEGGTPEVGASIDFVVTGSRNARVLGFAYWGASRLSGPNIGLLEFDVASDDLRAFRQTEGGVGGGPNLDVSFQFVDGGLIVTDNSSVGWFGHNVGFGFKYTKVGSASLPKLQVS